MQKLERSGQNRSEITDLEKAIARDFSVFFERIHDNLDQESVGLRIARRAAMDAFLKNGFPSRKKERWHYTDLRKLIFSIPSIEDRENFFSEENYTVPIPFVSDSIVLSAVSKKKPVPSISGIEIIPFALCLKDEKIKFSKDFSSDDCIGQINTAMFDCGFRVVITENTNVSQVIELQNLHSIGDRLQRHVRFSIYVKKGARVTFIENQISGAIPVFVSSISTVEIEEDAKVLWIIVRDRAVVGSTELNQFHAELKKKAQLEFYSISVGIGLLRQEICVTLVGSEALLKLYSLNLLSGKSHADTTLNISHEAERTVSSQVIRNVITENARGVFQGKVIVLREAQKTDASMVCNSLILSDGAEFDTKPELEIFADEVSCRHGATITGIDDFHLFYLMARGIPKKQAQGILIKAFVEENILQLKKISLQNRLRNVLNHWLSKY